MYGSRRGQVKHLYGTHVRKLSVRVDDGRSNALDCRTGVRRTYDRSTSSCSDKSFARRCWEFRVSHGESVDLSVIRRVLPVGPPTGRGCGRPTAGTRRALAELCAASYGRPRRRRGRGGVARRDHHSAGRPWGATCLRLPGRASILVTRRRCTWPSRRLAVVDRRGPTTATCRSIGTSTRLIDLNGGTAIAVGQAVRLP